jgi:hypothetical protein
MMQLNWLVIMNPVASFEVSGNLHDWGGDSNLWKDVSGGMKPKLSTRWATKVITLGLLT